MRTEKTQAAQSGNLREHGEINGRILDAKTILCVGSGFLSYRTQVFHDYNIPCIGLLNSFDGCIATKFYTPHTNHALFRVWQSHCPDHRVGFNSKEK